MLQYKIEFEGSLRRGSVASREFRDVKFAIKSLLSVDDLVVQYRDQDGDVVTVGSEQEWDDLVKENGDKPLRLIVVMPGTKAEQVPVVQEEEPEHEQPKPEIPFAKLARALTDSETVGKIQAVASSAIITEAVNSIARAYTDSRGDVGAAGLVAMNHIPMLMGLVAELVDQVPELKETGQQAFSFGSGRFFAARSPMPPPPNCDPPQMTRAHHGHGGPIEFPQPHCGPPPMMGTHHGHGGPIPPPFWGGGGPHFKTVHPQVFCDGCASDAGLKRASFVNGHMTRRGFINGLRYKSQSVNDFDLCESCKSKSNRFPDRAYGPFDVIQPPHVHQQAPHRGRGGGCWRSGGGGAGMQNCGEASMPGCGAAAAAAVAPDAPGAKPAAQAANTETFFDFGQAIREAIVRGAQTVADVTKNEDKDFSELARAIAASLQGPVASLSPEHVPVVEAEKAQQDQQGNTSEGEWETVYTPAGVAAPNSQDDEFAKWGPQLNQLSMLGFSDSETYIRFLEEEGGDLDRVVSRIVSREA